MNSTCPKCGSSVSDEQSTCPECGAPIAGFFGQSAESPTENFVRSFGQERSGVRHSWWSRQPKLGKIGLIVGPLVVVALLVILPFWSSWFGSDDARTLHMTQEKLVPLTLESMRYVSSPRDSSQVAATFTVFFDYDFRLESAVAIQGQKRLPMRTLDTSGSGALRQVEVVYFPHFDIFGASTIDVTLALGNGSKEDHVFTIPAK